MSKILISGQWLWPHYQEACAKALEKLGHSITRFGWQHHFFEQTRDSEPRFKSFIAQRQHKYIVGPVVSRINSDLISRAQEEKPEIIWLYNDTLAVPRTLLELKKLLPRAVFAQYANDNPWGRKQSAITWRHFKKSVPLFDVNFCYRASNKRDLLNAGARHAVLLRSYYIPEETFPLEPSIIGDKFRSEVVFAGHYENDGRLDMLAAIAEAGWTVSLFGTSWNGPLSRLPRKHVLKKFFPVMPVRGEDYRKAICGSKIALSFLSKLNEDTYTRRNFEIPAMKGFMLSEYSDDLADLFAEGTEAEFFRSKDELISKVRHYLEHGDERSKIAACGFERVRRDGHDVVSRMRQFMDEIHRVTK